MDQEKAFELAKEIIHLDMERDRMWESLMAVVGPRAHELLRAVQNGWCPKS